MQLRRFSFLLSPISWAAIIIIAVFVAAVTYLHESGALSPGPLSAAQPHGESLGGFASHAAFEQECGHCHAPVHCISDTGCQDCHIEVARQRMTANGLHGRLPATKCQACHVEHQGREAVITTFAFANVDHEKLADFSLARHRTDYDGTPLTCETCHTQDRYISDTVDCVTCHTRADHTFVAEHMEQFGLNCLDCHDGRDRMANFDHEQVYALEGAHETPACEDCHFDQTFARTPRACIACHAEPDVHAGQFGLDCARCHTVSAWVPAELTQHAFLLDHGGEGDVACETCHTHTYVEHTCYGCHDHDPGQMRERHAEEDIVEFEDCVGCHPTGLEGEAGRLRDRPVDQEQEGEIPSDAG